MIDGFKQTDRRLKREIQKWGCLFLCIAEASPYVYKGEEGIALLNWAWDECVKKGGISGDLDGDGNADGSGESEITNYAVVLDILKWQVRYDGYHHSTGEAIPDRVCGIIGCWKWKGTHFVIMSRDLKRVVFDPMGESNTVKYGRLDTVRWFYGN